MNDIPKFFVESDHYNFPQKENWTTESSREQGLNDIKSQLSQLITYITDLNNMIDRVNSSSDSGNMRQLLRSHCEASLKLANQIHLDMTRPKTSEKTSSRQNVVYFDKLRKEFQILFKELKETVARARLADEKHPLPQHLLNTQNTTSTSTTTRRTASSYYQHLAQQNSATSFQQQHAAYQPQPQPQPRPQQPPAQKSALEQQQDLFFLQLQEESSLGPAMINTTEEDTHSVPQSFNQTTSNMENNDFGSFETPFSSRSTSNRREVTRSARASGKTKTTTTTTTARTASTSRSTALSDDDEGNEHDGAGAPNISDCIHVGSGVIRPPPEGKNARRKQRIKNAAIGAAGATLIGAGIGTMILGPFGAVAGAAVGVGAGVGIAAGVATGIGVGASTAAAAAAPFALEDNDKAMYYHKLE